MTSWTEKESSKEKYSKNKVKVDVFSLCSFDKWIPALHEEESRKNHNI